MAKRKEITEGDITAYLYELRRKDPKFKLKYGRPWWLIAGFKLLFWKKLEDWLLFTTTICSTIYVSSRWNEFPPAQKLCILRHEYIHIKQFQKYTFPLMVLLYLLLPFPVIFALGRALLEREAYNETIKARVEYYGATPEIRDSTKELYISVLTGPSYGWAFPFKSIVRKWFEKAWIEACHNPSS